MIRRKPQNPAENKPPRRYETRVVVPAPMPPRCPNCFNHSSKITGGTKFINGTRREYRTCTVCGAVFQSWRKMTATERKEHPEGV